MAAVDFTEMAGGLSLAQVQNGVTTGGSVSPPLDGGTFFYVFNSFTTDNGAVGFVHNGTNFNPVAAAKGASISAAMKRGPSAGTSGFSPFIFVCATTDDFTTNPYGYMLGLSDEEPYRLILKKGLLSDGVTASDNGVGVLSTSNATYNHAAQLWHHVRLDVVANANSDNIINVYTNPLTGLNGVTNPEWTKVTEMEFVDDVAGVNSTDKNVDAAQVLPLTGGHLGYAFHSENATRRAYIDHIQPIRQL